MNCHILKTKADLQLWRSQQNSPIGFVPTMGSLHKGHGELIKTCKKSDNNQHHVVLVSIFVNPLQFGPKEDFANYPRDLDQDCSLATKYGADAIWAPSVDEIFPGDDGSHFKIKVPSRLQAHLCGRNRPGHFDGVATVISKLLCLVKPNVLVLGEKDWQQLVILKQLIRDLGLPVKVVSVKTIRDKNGLAYSSRNLYLNSSEKEKALSLPRSLAIAAKQTLEGKVLDLKQLHSSITEKGLEVEYLELLDPHLLQPVDNTNKLSLLAAAVRCGKTRLIDHTFLMQRQPIIAIDGPAGAGKSTVTKAVAKKLGLLYLDTGAMYRAVTWLIKEEGINLQNESAITQLLDQAKLELKPHKSGKQKVLINEQDVTEAIRSPEVTSLVSEVAALGNVRLALTSQQKNMGFHGGLVAEGRDIGTAVFPNAELKVFLTASSLERAKRRSNDLKQQGYLVPNLKDLESEIIERDRLDSSREISPLIKAIDAEELITDGMNIEEVVDALITLFRLKVPQEVWPNSSE